MPSWSFSSSYSSTSSWNNGQRTGQTFQHQTSSTPSGTTVRMQAQNHGQPAIQEIRRFDPDGRQILEDGRTLGPGARQEGIANRRIEDVSDDQKGRDRLYEERMEEEYAKREGGA